MSGTHSPADRGLLFHFLRWMALCVGSIAVAAGVLFGCWQLWIQHRDAPLDPENTREVWVQHREKLELARDYAALSSGETRVSGNECSLNDGKLSPTELEELMSLVRSSGAVELGLNSRALLFLELQHLSFAGDGRIVALVYSPHRPIGFRLEAGPDRDTLIELGEGWYHVVDFY